MKPVLLVVLIGTSILVLTGVALTSNRLFFKLVRSFGRRSLSSPQSNRITIDGAVRNKPKFSLYMRKLEAASKRSITSHTLNSKRVYASFFGSDDVLEHEQNVAKYNPQLQETASDSETMPDLAKEGNSGDKKTMDFVRNQLFVARISFGANNISWWEYLKTRFKHLLSPTSEFLVLLMETILLI